ncbi:hypothetical protein D910_01994 [Dendroctonus ponderosae]
MITGRILDLVIGALIFASLTESLPARLKERNLLYSEPGVVAVYIRPGDTPLQDINPDLAEAFNFNDVKYGRRAFGRDINKILNEKKENSVLFSSGELAEGESYAPKKKSLKERGESHIQKIPKH